MGSVIFKKPPIKRLIKEGMFGVDMHFHTCYSLDAISKVETAIKKAYKKGYGFAVTDHNEIKGAVIASKLGKEKSVVVIPGIEITCKNGVHMIGYFHDHHILTEFFNKAMKPKMNIPFRAELSVTEVMQRIKDHGGVVCSPHPYTVGAVGIKKFEVTKKMEKSLDLIEVINGYNFRRSNIKAAYWAASINKGTSGGSDGHATIELGKVLTFTKGRDTESILREAIKNKSAVIGKEENILLKAVMAVRKESQFIKRSKRQHLARKLIRSQLGPEYAYFKDKFKNGKVVHFMQHHNIIKNKGNDEDQTFE